MHYPFPIGADWNVFIPAIQTFLEGGNPYLVGEGFGKVYEPFWTFIFLAPFAVLPFWIGRMLLFFVSLSAFLFSALKMGATRTQAIFFILSAAVLGCLNNGNIDWLVTLGLWMPPQIGLFFVMMKPQVGVGIALFWMYSSYRSGGLKHVLWVFTPVSLAYLLSFALYGFWPLQLLSMDHNPWNMGIWPWGLIPGLILLFFSLRKKQKNLSIVSGPLLAPYTSQFSYSSFQMGLFDRPVLFYIAWVALWIPVVVRLIV